jgi:hypothetical protein
MSNIDHIQTIITNNNISPKWFITIKFAQTKSFTLSKHNDKLINKSDAVNLDKVQKNTNYFINLLYKAIYKKSRISRISNKFKILVFLEKGYANYDYHAHLIVEEMLNYDQKYIYEVLKTIQSKHPSIDKYSSGIDIIPYAKRHNHYVMKDWTKNNLPLSTICSRL